MMSDQEPPISQDNSQQTPSQEKTSQLIQSQVQSQDAQSQESKLDHQENIQQEQSFENKSLDEQQNNLLEQGQQSPEQIQQITKQDKQELLPKQQQTPSQSHEIEEEQPPKQSFFQSLWSFFFKPKEVATYPPNFPPPPKDNKKTLIFDLDETLIHSSDFPPHPKVEAFKTGDPPFYVFKRPGLDDFLRKYSKKFDIFIFTSAYQCYADPIINAICPYLDEQHRLYRNSCVIENNEIHKDLDAFKRPPTDLIFVEDNFNLKKYRPKNTIIVQRWEGTPFDKTLINWLPDILDDCEKADDVRKVIEKVQDECHFPNKA